MSTQIVKGDPAPAFSLKNQNDQTISLADFKGQWLVLYFYPKDNTPGCTLEAIDFTRNKKEFDKVNATVLGISADSVASHKRFCERKNLSIDLLSDDSKSMLSDYGVLQKKKMFGREFMGIIRSTFLINPDQNIAQIWPKVKVTGHAQKVLEAINELS